MTTAEQSLREENEVLRERVRQLEEELRGGTTVLAALRARLRLTKSEALLVGALITRRSVTTQAVEALLYGSKMEPPTEYAVRTWIYKVRRKLRPHGIAIQTDWGTGYFLDDDAHQRLAAIVRPS